MTLGSRPASPRWTTTVETDRPLAWEGMTIVTARWPSSHSLFGCQTPTCAPREERCGPSLPRARDDLKRIFLSSRRSPLPARTASPASWRVRHGAWTIGRTGGEDGTMSSFEAAGTRISIDPETLREIVLDPAALAEWCAEHPTDPRAVAFLRMLGRLDEAAIAGRQALEAPGLSPVMRAVRRTRYAHVLQWQGAYLAAEEQLDLAAEETGLEDPTSPSSLSALASVFQHR